MNRTHDEGDAADRKNKVERDLSRGKRPENARAYSRTASVRASSIGSLGAESTDEYEAVPWRRQGKYDRLENTCSHDLVRTIRHTSDLDKSPMGTDPRD